MEHVFIRMAIPCGRSVAMWMGMRLAMGAFSLIIPAAGSWGGSRRGDAPRMPTVLR